MTHAPSAADSMPASPGGIRRIAPSAVHRITSNQVVLDLQTAVKELVENSLDAHASSIDIRFVDYGLVSFEVADNGSGIPQQDWQGIGLKYHTSKLRDWSMLQEGKVETFGFRGEAISSLCALCESISCVTATQDSAPIGTILPLLSDGSIDFPSKTSTDLSSLKKIARQRGTTITVTGLFRKLPVRRKEFEKNVKREYAKAQVYLQAYALISQGVRWNVSNTPKGG